MTDKEKIDYEIKARREAADKNLGDWGCAGFIALIICFVIFCLAALIFG